MNDQADMAVEELAEALDDDPTMETDELEEDEQTSDQEGQLDEDDEADDDAEQDEDEDDEGEEESEPEPSDVDQKFKLTVKNDKGEDEDVELTLSELASGYMRDSDYTRKRQVEAETLRQKEAEYQSAVIQTQQQSVEAIDQLKALVIQSAAPELAELTPQLAAQDPSRYVELQAKHDSVQQTLMQLDQTKQQTELQSQQVEMQARGQGQELDRAYIAEKIPEFTEDGYQDKAVAFAEKTYGITANDLAFLTSRPVFKDGGLLDGGKFVHMLNDAMKFHNLETQKPIQMKKVKSAPKVIKPNAPRPKRNRNREAEKRLKKFGRVEDLAALL